MESNRLELQLIDALLEELCPVVQVEYDPVIVVEGSLTYVSRMPVFSTGTMISSNSGTGKTSTAIGSGVHYVLHDMYKRRV